ncbi:hypothetical protein ACFL27_11875 [candidate division CSSED10-310 bacterium]|uniref:Uncharacterized protein n=1 Tax=candidate division CSSED10-310 bacterium TaxID=2855610 RepID=A0ABV6YXH0_UNCC1
MKHYIRHKAALFIKLGSDIYRKGDFFSMPSADLSAEILNSITNGCQQILAGSGFTRETPFTSLSISDLYDLMEMFHFHPILQQAQLGKDFIMDEIEFRHRVEHEDTVTVFNKLPRKKAAQ